MAEEKQKHAGGRPTKYKTEYCEKLIEFFDIEPTAEVPVVTTFKNGTTRESTELRANDLRFLSAFARKIGVCHDTLCEWCKVYPEFSEAYARAKALQKEHLIICGLQDLYNSRFAMFTAKNITDMRDKTEHELTGKDGKPIPLQIVDFSKIKP